MFSSLGQELSHNVEEITTGDGQKLRLVSLKLSLAVSSEVGVDAVHEIGGSCGVSTWNTYVVLMEVQVVFLNLVDVFLIARDPNEGKQQIKHLIILHELLQ